MDDSEGENMETLIVVDMQNDFVSGVLGSKEAVEIMEYVETRVKGFDGEIIFTKDTHTADYMNTREGQYLPVEHCIRGTEGWEICKELLAFAKDAVVIEKPTFGSTKLVEYIGEKMAAEQCAEADMVFTLLGVCTDICVISNAMLLKANYPESKIVVESNGCAGVTPATHNTALEAMKMCHIDVV